MSQYSCFRGYIFTYFSSIQFVFTDNDINGNVKTTKREKWKEEVGNKRKLYCCKVVIFKYKTQLTKKKKKGSLTGLSVPSHQSSIEEKFQKYIFPKTFVSIYF